MSCRRTLLPILPFALFTAVPAQEWDAQPGRSPSGLVPLHQAVRDAGSDTLALLVASHPDAGYVLPAALLRFRHGVRVAVLLATRGGGGQNSRGPETGDALERIRTLEAEAGCRVFGADLWYLDRQDGGFRRTADEAFAEWGREGTLADLARLIRTIRPDVVLTTHHVEEDHGHDLALVELLPEAVAKAADPTFVTGSTPPHRVQRLFLGGPSSPGPQALRFALDEMEPVRGATFRRLAYDVLARLHASAGPIDPIDKVFAPELVLMPEPTLGEPASTRLVDGLRSVFDPQLWPFDQERRESMATTLSQRLYASLQDRDHLIVQALAALGDLRALQAPAGSEASLRLRRREDALERVVLHACSLQLEIETEPGTVAVPGEEMRLYLRLHNGSSRTVTLARIEAVSAGEAVLDVDDGNRPVAAAGTLRTTVGFRVPLAAHGDVDPGAAAFHGDRYVPPVRLRAVLLVDGIEVPLIVDAAVELRPAVQLGVVPRALLLSRSSRSVKFTVDVLRNSRLPVDGLLEARAPSGYLLDGSRQAVLLRDLRGDSFRVELHAPEARKSGVDLVRIVLGDNQIALPVHKVDVDIDPQLRVGIVRGNDDTLTLVVGIGGFGLHWSELSDADLAVRELGEFDTIVVDIRGLRDRPAARRSFRRLLEFAATRGRRLVVFYHKDVEFNPPGEDFRGAPFVPFVVGKSRVTRPDAPVRVLHPDHVLLTKPNAVSASDWDAWEQERGLHFPSAYTEQYEELLEMNDPGRPPERSALLYARTGSGEYVYCALSLYRQLKKLHPGAVRLLANLLTPQRR